MASPTQGRDSRGSSRDPFTLLVIQPDIRCDLDRFEGWLVEAGAELNVIRPFVGDQVPPAVEADGLVVLGGGMSANDTADFPWLEDIRTLYRSAVAAEKPTLGICLGGQLLAQAFGGEVALGRDGLEVGLTEVTYRETIGRDPVFGGLSGPFPAMNFHYDEIQRLPEGSEWLAGGSRYPHQAFRLGSAWGLQFHPEITPDRLRQWNRIGEANDPSTTAELEEKACEFDRWDDEVATAMRQVAENFGNEVQRCSDLTTEEVRILIVQPDPIGLPERLDEWLDEPGVEVTLVRPFLGEQVPGELDTDALVVMGGGMNAYAEDEFPWLADIKDLLRHAVNENRPVLGICLGAQMLAASFGGSVSLDDTAGPEAGVVQVEWTGAGQKDPLTRGLPTPFRSAAFHFDGISHLPPGAVRLGTGGLYPNQAFRVGSAVGVQFHPECSPSLFRQWSDDSVAHKPELKGGLDANFHEFVRLDPEVSHGTGVLISNFLASVRESVRTAKEHNDIQV